MSLLPTAPGKIALDFSRGISIYVVLRILGPLPARETSICGFRRPDGELQVALSVNAAGNLIFRVSDSSCTRIEEVSTNVKPLLERYFVACCQIEPDVIHSGSVKLRLGINVLPPVEKVFAGEFGKQSKYTFFLGPSEPGARGVAFDIANIMKLDGLQSRDGRSRTIYTLREKYSLW